MCGIVGAISKRDITGILLKGLKRLEYRGYDSAGMAILNQGLLERIRRPGKVAELGEALAASKLSGAIGIAHTRWATHGIPSEHNAHPHICNGRVAIVHNGIIENFHELREQQLKAGFRFTSETDTEVIAHQIVMYLDQGKTLFQAVQSTVKDLKGAYALGVIDRTDENRMIAARSGSPLVIGLGENENFIASDVHALLKETNRFIYLENGDIAELSCDKVSVFDQQGNFVEREIKSSKQSAEAAEKGEYPHYMLKEIFEQPRAIADTLEGRIINGRIVDEILGPKAREILDKIE